MTYELNKKIALVANIEAYCEQDPIFKAGVSVTCLLMDKRGQSSRVSFVGISPSSPFRLNEKLWKTRSENLR